MRVEQGETRGNFISEWFGYRVWPTVDSSTAAIQGQPARRCPFLTGALRSSSECIKRNRGYPEATGVCTISSDSNGVREDWLACPFRVFDQQFTLFQDAIRTILGATTSHVLLYPVTVLHREDLRSEMRAALAEQTARVFLFSANKLGGEIDLPETDASPGGKVDVSVIELMGLAEGDSPPDQFGNHLFLEIQTADFHGSPLHAVGRLADKCPSDSDPGFHEAFEAALEDAGVGVEGPNKANIFKRTIYQMIYKIQFVKHPLSAGFVIVLPVPVWGSWLRHLGQPTLDAAPGDKATHILRAPGEQDEDLIEAEPAWILVFDIDRESPISPQPLKVVDRILTSSAALVHYPPVPG